MHFTFIPGDEVTPKIDYGCRTADHLQEWVGLFSQSNGPSNEHLVSLDAQAVDAASDEYGKREALEWAEGYVPTVSDRQPRKVSSSGSVGFYIHG